MRIKLRLYQRDLDLLTIKHNPLISLSDIVIKSLYTFVETGECARISIPRFESTATLHISEKAEECNITINEEKYPKIIEYLYSLRDGMRNNAIKVIVRASITNPFTSQTGRSACCANG